jgi:hypothetical protein
MAAQTSSRQRVVLYVTAAVLAGYACAWGFIALGIACLFAAGMEFHDAEALASMLGLLVFLAAFLWVFTERSLLRVWLVLAGGGVLMATVASLIQTLFVPAS